MLLRQLLGRFLFMTESDQRSTLQLSNLVLKRSRKVQDVGDQVFGWQVLEPSPTLRKLCAYSWTNFDIRSATDRPHR